ncbi:MAG TPA: HAMP domain-containing sensor histidine kinase, partial [Bacteroidales bacterium]|nr:HAMP domain-containing sensor histidine kinase [Bacteroidales bacterium]
HDLRSPFTTLMGYAGLLSDDYDEYSEEERKDMIKHIKDAAENNFLLLENLLTWSRSQRGQIKVNAVKTDIGKVSMEVIGILNPVAVAKNIQLTNKITSGTFAWADISMVHTMLLNLTNNAIKFTNPGGFVIVEAGISGDKIQVSVKDNGIGIAQEEVEKIFKVDVAHSTPGTANEKGTGLGLLICKEFAEKLGGTIWVESEPGKGSTFIFTLPVS